MSFDHGKAIHTIEDAMQLLDDVIPMRVAWEPFYAAGKRKPPFLQNIPDENLVEYCAEGRIEFDRAIDLGCGIGRNAIYLAKRGGRVEALDLSGTAIAKARSLADQEALDITFTVGSVFGVEWAPAYFDFAYDSGLMHHLQPHRRPYYLEKIRRMLKPEGHLGMTCFGPEAAPTTADSVIYESGEMPPGIGYSEGRLRAILKPYFEILQFRPMQEMSNDSGLFGMKEMWAILMQPRAL